MRFDVIVIGGGIYGLFLAREASFRGLRVLIVEKGDWGSGTTAGWLRILHGGLRYLQSVDLPRFYESVRERSWFLKNFPKYVVPLPCVMPLYGSGPHSTTIMRAALGLNDLLSLHRNRGLPRTHQLKRGTIITSDEVVVRLPYIDTDNLLCGARWYDAVAVAPQPLLVAVLHMCQTKGAVALSHTEATGLHVRNGAVTGIETRASKKFQNVRSFQAPIVINATGHWAPAIAERFGFPITSAPGNSWAWNVLFDVPCSTETAGAVSARRSGAQTFFILPWQGKTLVGTGHAAAGEDDDLHTVPDDLVARFVCQINEAVPKLGLTESTISKVLAGRLPISQADQIKLSSRPMIVNHSNEGASGLYSLWGIKYTTARAVAERLMNQIVKSNR